MVVEVRHLQLFTVLLLQFAVLRPASGMFLVGLSLFNQNISNSDFSGWGPYVLMFGGISLTFALWSLYMMYNLTYPVIGRKHKTALTFAAVKLVIFLPIMQTFILGMLDWATGVFANRPFGAEVNIDMWSNFLLVLELPIIALLLYTGFPRECDDNTSNMGDSRSPLASQKHTKTEAGIG